MAKTRTAPEPAKPLGNPKPQAPRKRKEAAAPKRPGSVAGFYEILALICAALGAVNLGLGGYFAATGILLWWPCAVGTIMCFLMALGLLATAEIINRLLDIAESVRAISETSE